MPRLERTSRRSNELVRSRAALSGRLRHHSHERVVRHRHENAFAALVLSGDYLEAGDTGCHRVGPGSVVFHDRFEAHYHQVGTSGAEVLVLAIKGPVPMVHGRIEDPDAIVRQAERDPDAAARELMERSCALDLLPQDWPELLAEDLRCASNLSLMSWAEAHDLHPGSISRGFGALFGMTPAHFRTVQKARRAVALLSATDRPLAELAIEAGFSDQAHMTRTVRAITGQTARAIRAGLGGLPGRAGI